MEYINQSEEYSMINKKNAIMHNISHNSGFHIFSKRVAIFLFLFIAINLQFLEGQSIDLDYREYRLSDAHILDYTLPHFTYMRHTTREAIQGRIEEFRNAGIYVSNLLYATVMERMLSAEPDKRIFLVRFDGILSMYVKLNDNEFLSFSHGR